MPFLGLGLLPTYYELLVNGFIMTRVAVLDADRCKTKHCNTLCHRFCPIVRSRIEAIRFENNKAVIVESLCTGCGNCAQICPEKAIKVKVKP
jgi:ATP-binding cassette subfamily E protein 1